MGLLDCAQSLADDGNYTGAVSPLFYAVFHTCTAFIDYYSGEVSCYDEAALREEVFDRYLRDNAGYIKSFPILAEMSEQPAGNDAAVLKEKFMSWHEAEQTVIYKGFNFEEEKGKVSAYRYSEKTLRENILAHIPDMLRFVRVHFIYLNNNHGFRLSPSPLKLTERTMDEMVAMERQKWLAIRNGG
jgi:hypothetical protein